MKIKGKKIKKTTTLNGCQFNHLTSSDCETVVEITVILNLVFVVTDWKFISDL